MKINGIIHTEVEINEKELGKALLEEVKALTKKLNIYILKAV